MVKGRNIGTKNGFVVFIPVFLLLTRNKKWISNVLLFMNCISSITYRPLKDREFKEHNFSIT